MNNCIWCAIMACDGKDCNNCKYLVFCDSEAGSMIYIVYESEVETALKPVHENWSNIFNAYMKRF